MEKKVCCSADTPPIGDINWKAFEEAVLKINKLRDREGVFVTRDVARARRNYSKFKDESNENSCD